jgi:CRISPR/Cas system-associated exonuclease Cas4 (RecB family)
VLARLGAEDELAAARDAPVELEREQGRFVLRVDRHREQPAPVELGAAVESDGQLALFADLPAGPPPAAPALAPLVAPPAPPLHRARTLSFTALSIFERCSYRYYAERVVGMRPRRQAADGSGEAALLATEIGDAVHRLLEAVELPAPQPPDSEVVRTWYPTVTDEELALIGRFVEAYCASPLAARIAGLDGPQKERRFAFAHDGVLLRGVLDVFHLARGHATVVDYKTNSLAEATPEEIVASEYRLQRIVYALACFRAAADEVTVHYQFLERPHAVVSETYGRERVPELERELSLAIAAIQAGTFVPTPSELACAGCPALDLVCAGPRLRNGVSGAARAPALAGA